MAKLYRLVSDESGNYRTDLVIHPGLEEDHGCFRGLYEAKAKASELLDVDVETWEEMELEDHYFAFTPEGTRVELQKQLGRVEKISVVISDDL